MKATERNLQQLLHCSDQYVIPAFQRYYTWKTDNWEQLLSDVEALLDSGHEDRRHFMGAIVTIPDAHQPGSIPAYQVIDGQQRLTTVSLLLAALRDVALEQGWGELAAEIEENYLIHRFKKGRERYKVFPRLRDRAAYLAAIDKKSLPSMGDQVSIARDFFVTRIRKAVQTELDLWAFFTTLITRLDFVAVTLSGENPYQIFRSLNSTGVDLTQADLIRNHVFMTLGAEEQDEFDQGPWRALESRFLQEGKLDGTAFEAFFRDALMRDGIYLKKDGTFEAFERRYPAHNLDPHAVVEEMQAAAALYNIVRGVEPHDQPEVVRALAGIRDLNVTTAYPLVLVLLELHASSRISTSDLVRALRGVSGFVMRRLVCDQSSRGYSDWFVIACRGLAKAENPVDAVLTYLHSKGWPTDEVFGSRFVHFPLYGSKYGRAALDALELAHQAATEPVSLDRCSIEHVVPQSINPGDPDGDDWIAVLGSDWRKHHAEWLHTPGNLTLVGEDYNREMSNKAFAMKKPKLANSKVYLNQHFRDQSLVAWDLQAIVVRGKELAEKASMLWVGPPATVDPV